ncbi:MAG: hypothetical protein WA063_03440 [Minisyncoccia bacterium]
MNKGRRDAAVVALVLALYFVFASAILACFYELFKLLNPVNLYFAYYVIGMGIFITGAGAIIFYLLGRDHCWEMQQVQNCKDIFKMLS